VHFAVRLEISSDWDPLNFQDGLTTSVTTTIFYGLWNYIINWINRPLT
jgi:hypothetical protein